MNLRRSYPTSEMSELVREAKRYARIWMKSNQLVSIRPGCRSVSRRIRCLQPRSIGKMTPVNAERIWQWWKPATRRSKFPFHALALRLIVLTQLSSCSVERVFSKLEGIRKVCGEKLCDDMAEIRLFLRCNGDLEPLVNKLDKFKN